MLNHGFKLQSLLQLRQRELDRIHRDHQQTLCEIQRLDETLLKLQTQRTSVLHDCYHCDSSVRLPAGVDAGHQPDREITTQVDISRILETQGYLRQLEQRLAEFHRELQAAKLRAEECRNRLIKSQQKVHTLERLMDQQNQQQYARQQTMTQAEIDQWNNATWNPGSAPREFPRS